MTERERGGMAPPDVLKPKETDGAADKILQDARSLIQKLGSFTLDVLAKEPGANEEHPLELFSSSMGELFILADQMYEKTSELKESEKVAWDTNIAQPLQSVLEKLNPPANFSAETGDIFDQIQRSVGHARILTKEHPVLNGVNHWHDAVLKDAEQEKALVEQARAERLAKVQLEANLDNFLLAVRDKVRSHKSGLFGGNAKEIVRFIQELLEKGFGVLNIADRPERTNEQIEERVKYLNSVKVQVENAVKNIKDSKVVVESIRKIMNV